MTPDETKADPACDCLAAVTRSVTGCVCDAPGNCPRHGCAKTPHFHQLCRTRPEYFSLYEEGRGPGCVLGSIARAATVSSRGQFGLGDLVAWCLGLIGVRPWPGCGCSARKAWLNRVVLWRWDST